MKSLLKYELWCRAEVQQFNFSNSQRCFAFFACIVKARTGSKSPALSTTRSVIIILLLRIFRIFQQSEHIAYFFPHQLAFSTTFFILFVFLLPISIRFRCLNHLVANRMASSMSPDPCGTRWGSWFQAILYHISASYLAFMRSAYF